MFRKNEKIHYREEIGAMRNMLHACENNPQIIQ